MNKDTLNISQIYEILKVYSIFLLILFNKIHYIMLKSNLYYYEHYKIYIILHFQSNLLFHFFNNSILLTFIISFLKIPFLINLNLYILNYELLNIIIF